MANRNDMPERMQDPQTCDLNVPLKKPTEPKFQFPLTLTQDALDLSCKRQTKSSSINVQDLKDPYPSLVSTTSDQCNQANISTTDMHSPYGTVFMSPNSDTNSPKKRMNEPPAMNNNFPTNYASNVGCVISPSVVIPVVYPSPHLLSNSETISEAISLSREVFPTSSSIATSSMQQIQQSLSINDTRIIPQTFPHAPILQSAVALSGKTELSTVSEAQSETIKKMTRPFKAYPKDSMCFNKDEQDRYMKFRDRLLQSVKKINEHPNPKMRRTSKSPALPNSTVDEKDDAYWERRRKNNAAAKRSRDARRAKEDELAIKAAFFQHENQVLKNELQCIRNICMFYNIDVDFLLTKRP